MKFYWIHATLGTQYNTDPDFDPGIGWTLVDEEDYVDARNVFRATNRDAAFAAGAAQRNADIAAFIAAGIPADAVKRLFGVSEVEGD